MSPSDPPIKDQSAAGLPNPLALLRRLERLAERELEGRVRRLVGTPLQPVELAKAAAREMDASRAIGVDGPQVANRYELRVNPIDYERFSRFRQALARDVEQHLEAQARSTGARPVDAWDIELLSDPSVSLGEVRVAAEMVDVPEREAPQTTQRLSAVAAPIGSAPRLLLGEEEYVLREPITRVGRALDNEIVLSDPRVSRYHAQIRGEAGRFRIVDLASSNGTFVAGRRIDETWLAPDDDLSFGGVAARFVADST